MLTVSRGVPVLNMHFRTNAGQMREPLQAALRQTERHGAATISHANGVSATTQRGDDDQLSRPPVLLTLERYVRRMAMSEAAVTSKGQITIPVGIRKSLGLEAGDRVVFTQLADGTVVMRAKTRSVTALAGRQPKPSRKVRVEDMRYGGR